MAYYRNFEAKNVQSIIDTHVSMFYNYHSVKMLYKENLCPVIISVLINDNKTLPPKSSLKRQPGRPKKIRLRKRSKFSNNDESTIICSVCHQPGHNKRTCEIRKKLKVIEKTTKDKQASESKTEEEKQIEIECVTDPFYAENLL
jgi:hypothetical protein